MSTVEQRGEVKPGRLRRLVTRAVLVLGGAAAATAAAWAIGTATAAADQLPLPPVDSIGGVVGSGVTAGAPARAVDAATGALDPVTHDALSAMKTAPVPQLPPPPADLATVTEQVRTAVLGVGARLAPSWTPAPGLLPAPATLIGGDTAPAALAPQAAMSTAVDPRIDDPQGPAPVSNPVAPARSAHPGSVFPRVVTGHPVPERTTDPGHGLPPAVPFAPPAGSPDSGGHATGGLAGGPGVGTSAVVVPAGVISRPVNPAGVHASIAPGEAPGTTPD